MKQLSAGSRGFGAACFFALCVARGCKGVDPGCPASDVGVNVIRASDGSTTEHVGNLPLLPHGTSQASYGPFSACSDFDGIIVLGGPAALDPSDSYYVKTKDYRQGLMMFIDHVNQERGGLAVGDRRYGLRIHWVGDSSMPDFVTNATAHAIRNLGADFVFPSYGSTATALVSKQAFAEHRLMLSWASASTPPHAQNNLSFGLMPLMGDFLRSAIGAISDSADAIDAGTAPSLDDRCAAPNCKASIKVGVIAANLGINLIGARQVAQQATTHGLAVATGTDEIGNLCCPSSSCCEYGDDYDGAEPLTVVFEQEASVDDMIDKLRVLKNAGVNVVVSFSVRLHLNYLLLEALERMDYSPLATVVTFSVDTEAFQNRIEGGWWQGEYVLGATPWHRAMNSYGDFSQLTSREWATKYEERWDGQTPSQVPAAAYTIGCILGAAIENASSVDTDQVAAALRGMDLQEFFVRVIFNDDGQIIRDTSDLPLLQFEPGSTEASVVHPPESAEFSATQFPTPTWAKRRCQIHGPIHGHAFGAELSDADRVAWQLRTSLECSGRGLCSNSGECICEPGYAGASCETEVTVVPQAILRRAQELVDGLNCRSEEASTQDTCTETAFVCGATCTDSEMVSNQTRLAFIAETVAMDHLSINGIAGEALSCSAASVTVSFSRFILLHINASQTGTTRRARGSIFANSSNLTISFSTVRDNVNAAAAAGSAGVYATESTIHITHTDFVRNSVQSAVEGLNAAAIACDASAAVVVGSRFAHNHGAAAIRLSAHASLQMNHSAVHDNHACIPSTAVCAATAGILIDDGSTASVHSTVFFNNQGGAAGAMFASGFGADLVALSSLFYSNRGLASTLASGAIAATGAATARIESCTFDNNLGTAPTAAGAVMGTDAFLTLSDSELSNNMVQAYPVGRTGAGGVHSERSSVSLSSCRFANNSAVEEDDGHATSSSFATEFFAFSPSHVRILDSVFAPYDDSHSAQISPGVARGMMRGSCEENPCSPGSDCSFANYSLSCVPCQEGTYSSDGISCKTCPAGKGPTENQQACAGCSGNDFSSFGVCQKCVGEASTDHSVCEPCPFGQAWADNGGCQCELGTYNASEGLITCVDQDYHPMSFDHDARYAIARDQLVNHRLQCINCPPCVDCFVRPIQVKPGFALAHNNTGQDGIQNKTLMRCRPETTHTDSFGAGELGVSVSGGKAQCLGGDLGALKLRCSTGHEGVLCGVCMPDFGRQNENECQPCESAVDPMAVGRLVGLVAGLGCMLSLILISIAFQIGDVYEGDEPSSNFTNPLSANSGSSTEQQSAGQQEHVVSWAKVFKTSKRILASGVNISIQPCKIFAGYFQIAAHMGDVLHCEFPPLVSAVFQRFKWLVVNINGLVALECAGLKTFHQTWIVEVIVVPVIMILFVVCFWLYRRLDQGDPAAANVRLLEESFFVLFLIYPFVTNKMFSILNCRVLDDKLEVLAADYSIDCNTPKHDAYEIVSRMLIVTFSMGVPFGLMLALARHRRSRIAQSDTPMMEYIQRRVMTELKLSDLSEIRAVIIDLKLGKRFGSLVNAYKPGYFVTEALDMLRKLMLVGILTVLDLGTTSQVVVGVFLSFSFFALHIKFLPYRHVEDNCLRATSELHLFIVMLMVLTLKGDLSGERWDVGTYDLVATVLFIVFVPVALMVAVAYKWRRVVNDDISDSENPRFMALVASAYTRHREGRDKDEDRQLLGDYVQSIEDSINSDYHVFISYRVSTDKALALQLYHALSDMVLVETGQKLRVYLDEKCLTDGQRWDEGFMQGLAASWVVLPILSDGVLKTMRGSDARESADNVLLEWLGALELFSREQVKAILPVISPGFDFSLVDELSSEAHEPTVSGAMRHLKNHATSAGVDDSDMLNGATAIVDDVASSDDAAERLGVKGTVAAILRYQGVQLPEPPLDSIMHPNQTDDTRPDTDTAAAVPPIAPEAMVVCAQRVLKTVAAVLEGTLDDTDLRKSLRYGTNQATEWPQLTEEANEANE